MKYLLCISLFISWYGYASGQSKIESIMEMLGKDDFTISIEKVEWARNREVNSLEIEKKAITFCVYMAGDSMCQLEIKDFDRLGYHTSESSKGLGKGTFPLSEDLVFNGSFVFSSDHHRLIMLKKTATSSDSTIIIWNDQEKSRTYIHYNKRVEKDGYSLFDKYVEFANNKNFLLRCVKIAKQGKRIVYDTINKNSYTYDEKNRLKEHNFINFRGTKFKHIYDYQDDTTIHINIIADVTEMQESADVYIYLNKKGHVIRKIWTRKKNERDAPLKISCIYNYNSQGKIESEISRKHQNIGIDKITIEGYKYYPDGLLQMNYSYTYDEQEVIDYSRVTIMKWDYQYKYFK